MDSPIDDWLKEQALKCYPPKTQTVRVFLSSPKTLDGETKSNCFAHILQRIDTVMSFEARPLGNGMMSGPPSLGWPNQVVTDLHWI